jgi:hypothetical protein
MWVLLAIGMSGWAGYGTARANYTLVSANVACVTQILCLLAGILSVTFAHVWARAAGLVGAVTLCAISATVGRFAHPIVVATLLAAAPAVRLGQVHASWKTWRSRSYSDVSIWTWALTATTSTLWTFNGLLVHDPLVIVMSASVSAMSVLVVALETLAVRYQRRAMEPGSEHRPELQLPGA